MVTRYDNYKNMLLTNLLSENLSSHDKKENSRLLAIWSGLSCSPTDLAQLIAILDTNGNIEVAFGLMFLDDNYS